MMLSSSLRVEPATLLVTGGPAHAGGGATMTKGAVAVLISVWLGLVLVL